MKTPGSTCLSSLALNNLFQFYFSLWGAGPQECSEHQQPVGGAMEPFALCPKCPKVVSVGILVDSWPVAMTLKQTRKRLRAKGGNISILLMQEMVSGIWWVLKIRDQKDGNYTFEENKTHNIYYSYQACAAMILARAM